MKTKLKVLLAVMLATCSLSARNLKTTSFFNEQLSLAIPGDFKLMEEKMLRFKYPSERRPSLVYTDEAASTNIAMNLLKQSASQAQIPRYLDDFVSQFESLFPGATWKSKGIAEIDGRKVGYLELVTPALDTDVYNLMFFTDLDGRLLLCSFNCVVRDMETWQPVAREIMYSLRVNK